MPNLYDIRATHCALTSVDRGRDTHSLQSLRASPEWRELRTIHGHFHLVVRLGPT